LNIPDGATLFLYQGGLVVGRGIELLLEVFEHINDPNIHLALMGRGNYEPRIKAAAERCSSIHFHPAVPYHDLVEYTSSADVGILSIQNLCLSYWYCMPNKLFEYIQARIPILSNNLHDSKMVIEEYNLGVVIPEYTLEALEAGIREIARQDLSVYQPGLEKAKGEFHWEKEEAKLLEIYLGV
jgi:glycosyltransferase involved in cell wall biosynthesis